MPGMLTSPEPQCRTNSRPHPLVQHDELQSARQGSCCSPGSPQQMDHPNWPARKPGRPCPGRRINRTPFPLHPRNASAQLRKGKRAGRFLCVGRGVCSVRFQLVVLSVFDVRPACRRINNKYQQSETLWRIGIFYNEHSYIFTLVSGPPGWQGEESLRLRDVGGSGETFLIYMHMRR